MSATPTSDVRVVSAEIERDGAYLLTRRNPDAWLGGLWEFPGGRVRDGETDTEALARALADRLDVHDVQVIERTLEVRHAYEGWTLTLAVYRVGLADDAAPRARRVADLAWVAPEDLDKYPFPPGDQKTVERLLRDDR